MLVQILSPILTINWLLYANCDSVSHIWINIINKNSVLFKREHVLIRVSPMPWYVTDGFDDKNISKAENKQLNVLHT